MLLMGIVPKYMSWGGPGIGGLFWVHRVGLTLRLLSVVGACLPSNWFIF